MTENVLGYTRLSQTSDTSIEDQKKEIRELADEHGFNLVNIYDDGQRASGFDNERPEYLELLEHIEEEDIDAIIVRDRDRLSRDQKERTVVMFELDEMDVDVWTTVDGQAIDFDDSEQVLLELLRNHFDDVFKRREIEKAKKKTRERINNGYHHGRPPYGLQFDDEKKHLEPDGDEYDTAIEVIQRKADGESYTDIVSALPVSRGTAHRIVQNADQYLAHQQ